MPRPTTVKIGLIGCGGIAPYHLLHLNRTPEANVVALADVDETRISRLQTNFPELYDCQVFNDYKDMLKSVDLDAVEILTPHTLHFRQAIDALERGLHALIEKPMVCTASHAKQLLEKTEERDRVVLVSYQRHYQPQFRYMKKVIDSGELGDIQFISALQCQEWLEVMRGTWRQNPALSGGGQLNDSGSHLLDSIFWTTGLTAMEVFAFIHNLGTPVDINSALSIKFDNEAQANISVVGNAPRWWEDITIWGSKGMILYRNGRLTHLPLGGEAILEPVKLPPGSDPDRNFINTIVRREDNESPPTCGLKVIELTEAAWKSARTGKTVKILH